MASVEEVLVETACDSQMAEPYMSVLPPVQSNPCWTGKGRVRVPARHATRRASGSLTPPLLRRGN